jgi:hypothetical protein
MHIFGRLNGSIELAGAITRHTVTDVTRTEMLMYLSLTLDSMMQAYINLLKMPANHSAIIKYPNGSFGLGAREFCV